MAIVKEYTLPGGTVIKFNDECYRDKTPEENKKECEKLNQTISRLLYKTGLAVK